MKKPNFKFWMILFILIAVISWSVLPNYNPSFDFAGKKGESKKEFSRSQSTSQPVGQAFIDEEESLENSKNDIAPVRQDSDYSQNKNPEKNDQQINQNAEKAFNGQDRNQVRTALAANKNLKESSLSSSGSATSQGSLMVGGASTPKEIKVSETGEGETLLLREALRQLLPGGSIFLQKGYYKVQQGEMRIPDSTIRGEGRESILEFNDTFRVGTSNLKFQNLKIIHYGTSEAFSVSAGKKLTLEKVFLQNNANDGVSVVNAHLVVNDLELRGSQHAIIMRDPISLEAQNLKLSDIDYGISFEGNKNFTFNGLVIKNSTVSPIQFVNEGTGQLICVRCTFDKPANNSPRLILRK